ncbi:G5 domain-containing protein [Gemella sp. GH3]|uniref:G5 domain-containing protein n=1 Tax=unclassified Gemella TaxID=2624949 RepID=UPI0015D027A3|nr:MULTISPECIES: G5 domain-containing protein [unclassified Gemella]MBF0714022.1 G5 domain-containing protein [Gemella sp. GH3.1]NYS50974.1 G5 domain-containing protein [Gemella sp. GH3]
MNKNKKFIAILSTALLTTSFVIPQNINEYSLIAKAENTVSNFDRNTIKKGNTVNITGTVTTQPGIFGGQGFYITTANNQSIYVYPGKNEISSELINKGDNISFTATVTEYNKNLQLVSLKDVKVNNSNNIIQPTKLTIDNLSKELQDGYIEINNIKVKSFKSQGKFKNTVITATDSNANQIEIFADNRIFGDFDSYSKNLANNDSITSVKGILTVFNGKYQIKPTEVSEINISKDNKSDESIETYKIGAIQGESHISPLIDKLVNIENVVVTKIDGNKGFYVQDIEPDNNPNTSDAIYVVSKEKVTVGDKLTIKGTVKENYGAGYAEKTNTDLTITQLEAKEVAKNGTSDLPIPIKLGDNIPKKIIDNDSFSIFDPQEDAIDFWESIEGMRVEIERPTILGPQKYGYLYVLPVSYKGERNNSGGISLAEGYKNTEIIAIMTGDRKFRAKANDYFDSNIIGNVTYDYSEYKVDVTKTTLPKKIDGNLQREKSNITFDEDKLTIASYNIENFSANSSTKETPNSKVEKIANSFINEINSPDIISLIEVQDNNGSIDDGTTSGVQSGERLANKIKELGGPEYKYIEVEPINNADGGKPGANIRVAYLYNPSRAKLIEKEVGLSADEAKFINGELTKNPVRISPNSKAFQGVRKSLAAEFDFKGERVVVINNHLKSKNGDNPLYGKVQPAIENSQASRIEQALEINKFIQEGLNQNPNLKFVLTGDFNDFEFSNTIKSLKGDILTDLLSNHDKADRYSYFYRGNNQSLDNILVSNNIINDVKFDAIHVNSPFMEEDGRASDHDPLLVQISFKKSATPDDNIPTIPEKPFVKVENINSTQNIPFEIERIETNELLEGEERVEREGTVGTKSITKRILKNSSTNEIILEEIISSETIKNPINKIIKVGKKKNSQKISNKTEYITYKEDIPFEIEEIETYELLEGEEKVERDGVKGVRTITKRITKDSTTNKMINEEIMSNEITTKPITKVIKVGIKKDNNNNNNNSQSKKTLSKTGEKNNNTSLLVGAILLLNILILKRRKNK